VVDATNLKTAHRVRYVDLAIDAHAPLVAIRLVAPYATLRKRVEAERDGYSQADASVLRGMRGTEERFSCPTVVVDTRYPIGPSVELIATLGAGA
jgi:predicted kinase